MPATSECGKGTLSLESEGGKDLRRDNKSRCSRSVEILELIKERWFERFKRDIYDGIDFEINI